jgi:two-component system cell cycle sensor histidine kinase/response regulator CckA
MTDAGRAKPALLVVDDDPFIRGVMATYLNGLGYELLIAASGQQALELSRAHAGPINLVITDLFMPEMNGPELVEQLLTERPTLRVIYISGDANQHETKHPRGVLSVSIAKPFTMNTLHEAIQALLA